jgi:hypothetical protein
MNRNRCRECKNGFLRRKNDWITGRLVVRRHSFGYCTDCFHKLDSDGSLTAKLEAIRAQEAAEAEAFRERLLAQFDGGGYAL